MSETPTTAACAPASAEALLRNVRVASPCPASWDEMDGGDAVRSCSQCSRKVYDLSAMTADEAANVLRDADGRLCVRFYRRADGTVMTRDCPRGLRAVRVRLAKGISVAFGALLVASGVSLTNKPRAEYPFLMRVLLDAVAPERPVMGGMKMSLPMAPPEIGEARIDADPPAHLDPTLPAAALDPALLRDLAAEPRLPPRPDPFAPLPRLRGQEGTRP